jgi:hypothetical protein
VLRRYSFLFGRGCWPRVLRALRGLLRRALLRAAAAPLWRLIRFFAASTPASLRKRIWRSNRCSQGKRESTKNDSLYVHESCFSLLIL